MEKVRQTSTIIYYVWNSFFPIHNIAYEVWYISQTVRLVSVCAYIFSISLFHQTMMLFKLQINEWFNHVITFIACWFDIHMHTPIDSMQTRCD